MKNTPSYDKGWQALFLTDEEDASFHMSSMVAPVSSGAGA